jgi:hypothetical protein
MTSGDSKIDAKIVERKSFESLDDYLKKLRDTRTRYGSWVSLVKFAQLQESRDMLMNDKARHALEVLESLDEFCPLSVLRAIHQAVNRNEVENFKFRTSIHLKGGPRAPELRSGYTSFSETLPDLISWHEAMYGSDSSVSSEATNYNFEHETSMPVRKVNQVVRERTGSASDDELMDGVLDLGDPVMEYYFPDLESVGSYNSGDPSSDYSSSIGSVESQVLFAYDDLTHAQVGPAAVITIGDPRTDIDTSYRSNQRESDSERSKDLGLLTPVYSSEEWEASSCSETSYNPAVKKSNKVHAMRIRLSRKIRIRRRGKKKRKAGHEREINSEMKEEREPREKREERRENGSE